MRIVHIVSGLPKAAGTTTFVENVARVQRTLGNDVQILLRGQRFLSADIYHIHGLWSFFLHRAAVYARRTGIPVIWSTHGMTAPWAMRHRYWKKFLPWRLYQKADLFNATFIHCTAANERAWNLSHGLCRCFMVPMGCNIPRMQQRLSNESAARVLLYVGRIHPVKAIDVLIKAFQAVPHVGWRLRIVGPGDGSYLKMLKSLAKEDVEFVGPKFDESLRAEYEGCDCLALVSHTENFGATVVDALSFSKPVIVSKHAPWSFVVLRGCGWWVENDLKTLSNTLWHLFAMPQAQLHEMGVRGRMLVEEQFTWPAVTRQLMEWYGKALLTAR